MDPKAIRAIVVDDEHNARKILPALIDWTSRGFSFVGEAANGNEALELVERLRPDVVFTDINMPYMDGLELARRVKTHDPLIKVVIMTAYAEFEYAKTGLQLGVSDFLLKPLEPEVVEKLAADLSKRLEEESAHWNEYRDMQLQLREQVAQFRERFLNDLISGSGEAGDLAARHRYFFEGEDPRPCQVAVVEVLVPKDATEEDRLLSGLKCRRFLETLLADRRSVVLFQDNNGRPVLLERDAATDLSALGEQCLGALRDRLGLQATIGVGGGAFDPGRLKEAYREALGALRLGVFQGRGQVMCFGEDIRLAGTTWDLHLDDIDEAVFLVKAGAASQAGAAVERLFTALAASRNATMEQAKAVATQYLTLLANALGEMGLAQVRLDVLAGTRFAEIFRATTLSELINILDAAARTAAETIFRSRSSKKVTMIDTIKEYLAREFRNPSINLGVLADRFHYNASYLSRVFKQELGVSFTDYLLKLRMEEAARLLEESDQKAYQIAEAVGILDPYYFSHCFKKVIGQSVQDYRKRI